MEQQNQNQETQVTPTGSNNAGNVIGWLERLLKLKKDYGLGSILTALMLMFVTIMMGMIAFKPDIIVKQIQRIQAEEHQIAVKQRMDADPQIRSYLLDMRNEVNADRSFILEAHNGGSNLTNLPFLYVDMTYESCKSNMDLLQDEYKNVRLQRYVFASYVYENNFWSGSIDDVKNVDEILYYRLQGDKVKYFALITLYGQYNLVGAIGIEYSDEEPIEAAKLKQVMYKYASKISYLLNYDLLEGKQK